MELPFRQIQITIMTYQEVKHQRKLRGTLRFPVPFQAPQQRPPLRPLVVLQQRPPVDKKLARPRWGNPSNHRPHGLPQTLLSSSVELTRLTTDERNPPVPPALSGEASVAEPIQPPASWTSSNTHLMPSSGLTRNVRNPPVPLALSGSTLTSPASTVADMPLTSSATSAAAPSLPLPQSEPRLRRACTSSDPSPDPSTPQPSRALMATAPAPASALALWRAYQC